MAKGMIQTEYNAFKYEAKDNRRIQRIALTRIFDKVGFYIFNLGLVSFFEQLIINLSMVVTAFWTEQELLDDLQRGLGNRSTSQGVRLPFLQANMYTILTFAYCLGNFVSLSSLQKITLTKPWLPTFFQLVNWIV